MGLQYKPSRLLWKCAAEKGLTAMEETHRFVAARFFIDNKLCAVFETGGSGHVMRLSFRFPAWTPSRFLIDKELWKLTLRNLRSSRLTLAGSHIAQLRMKQGLYIFDFDHTLCLHRLGPARRAEYETRLRAFLGNLRQNGHKLAVTSSNGQAREGLVNMDMDHFFHEIVADPTRAKKEMVLAVTSSFPDVTKDSVIFFDDDADNIEEVANLGITSICVSSFSGVPIPKD